MTGVSSVSSGAAAPGGVTALAAEPLHGKAPGGEPSFHAVLKGASSPGAHGKPPAALGAAPQEKSRSHEQKAQHREPDVALPTAPRTNDATLAGPEMTRTVHQVDLQGPPRDAAASPAPRARGLAGQVQEPSVTAPVRGRVDLPISRTTWTPRDLSAGGARIAGATGVRSLPGGTAAWVQDAHGALPPVSPGHSPAPAPNSPAADTRGPGALTSEQPPAPRPWTGNGGVRPGTATVEAPAVPVSTTASVHPAGPRPAVPGRTAIEPTGQTSRASAVPSPRQAGNAPLAAPSAPRAASPPPAPPSNSAGPSVIAANGSTETPQAAGGPNPAPHLSGARQDVPSVEPMRPANQAGASAPRNRASASEGPSGGTPGWLAAPGSSAALTREAPAAQHAPVWSSQGVAVPRPDPVRPPAPPETVQAWLDHPANGPLQLQLTDNGTNLGLRLETTALGASQLAEASDTLRQILERASEDPVAPEPTPTSTSTMQEGGAP